MQGTGVDKLFVHKWQYDQNWPYVVLSRVKTFSGLFLREPLKATDKIDYTLKLEYISFMRHFEQVSPEIVNYDLIPDNTNKTDDTNNTN